MDRIGAKADVTMQLLVRTSTQGGGQRQEFGGVDWIGLANMGRSSWSALPQRVEVSARSLDVGIHYLLTCVHCLLMKPQVSGFVARFTINFKNFHSELALTSSLIRQSPSVLQNWRRPECPM